MSFQSVCNEYTAVMRERVTQDTFGHLAPSKNTTYKGEIFFAVSPFGGCNKNILLIDFNMGDLDSSPWFYNALNEYIDGIGQSLETGAYTIQCTVRNYRFWSQRPIQLKNSHATQNR